MSFARTPTPADLAAALDHIEAMEAKTPGAAGMRVAYENILWALPNTKEFVFNQ